MNESDNSCEREHPPLDAAVRRRLWRLYLGALAVTLLAGAGLITALAVGWRSPTPRRPPDWTEADVSWHRNGSSAQEVMGKGYRIPVGKAGQATQIVGSRPAQDFIAEIALAPLVSGEEVEYGLLFRYQNPSNYYLFAVGGDGYYTIVAVRAGEQAALKEWQQWPHVHRGAAVNRLRVRCEEQRCRFFINDEFTAELTQVAPWSGDLGVWTQSFAAQPQDLMLEHMRVWSLDASTQ